MAEKFRDKMRAAVDRLAGASPLAVVAGQLAEVLDGERITPDDLDAAARENRPLLVEALDAMPDEAKAEARSRGGTVAQMIPRMAYGTIIELLSHTHPHHSQVLFARREWTIGQLDAARRWLSNGSG